MRWYTMSQVCKMFHVTRPTIGRWEADSGFPPRRYFGHTRSFSQKSRYGEKYTRGSNCRVLFPAEAVDTWAETRPARPPSQEGDNSSTEE
jgi:hypothetical protein